MEFDRLREARDWGNAGLAEAKEFLAALKGEKPPIVVFQRDREVSGYRTGSGRAEMASEKLMEVHKRIWEHEESELG